MASVYWHNVGRVAQGIRRMASVYRHNVGRAARGIRRMALVYGNYVVNVVCSERSWQSEGNSIFRGFVCNFGYLGD
jgi:hypothetical protein